MVYKNIQGLRAIAALMVVFSHIFWPLLPLRSYWLASYVDLIGPAGVDLFFVISGFVIYLSAQRLGQQSLIYGRWPPFKEFLMKRFLRIYPVYWIAFLCASLVMTKVEVAPSWLEQKPWWKLILLIDQPNNRILAAWTLQYEMYFYFICAIGILLFPRKILFIICIWMMIIFSVWLSSFWGYTASFSIYLSPIILEFAGGILVASLIRHKYSEYAVSSIGIGACGFLLGAALFHVNGGWWKLPPMWRVTCFALPSSFIVYGFAAIEQRKIWSFSNIWVLSGNASYSLYLWHQLIFAILAAFYIKTNIVSHVNSTVLGATFLASALFIAYVSYRFIEMPINKNKIIEKFYMKK